MTETPDFPNRLERLEQIVLGLAERQSSSQLQLDQLSQEVRELTQNVNTLTEDTTRVLARSAILDDVLLELRDNQTEYRQHFLENQRTTNASLQSLEAILLQLIRNSN